MRFEKLPVFLVKATGEFQQSHSDGRVAASGIGRVLACHPLWTLLRSTKFHLVKTGFTLLEVLVACALVAVLFAIALPTTSRISEYTQRTKSLSNMRQIGVAARLYANDHDQQLPGQSSAAGSPLPGTSPVQQWPALFCAYLTPSNPVVFLDPADSVTARLPLSDILSNVTNNTGYIYNGFDEFAVDDQPPPVIHLNRLSDQIDVVLLAQKARGAAAFCLSPIFQPVTNLLTLLNPGAYDGGSHYLFLDGSVRYVRWEDYSNNFWLVDKGNNLPLPPLPPLPPFHNNQPFYPGTPRQSLPLATIP